MISALTKLDPHCPNCLVEARIDDPPRVPERTDFVHGEYSVFIAEPINLTCWNCGIDYTARFYERQGEEL